MSPQLSPRAPPRPFPTKDGASEAADAATAPDEETGSSQSQPHADALDLHATVNVLTLQLIDEHEETRVAALEWLLMLHQKAPHKILAMDDGTFPALLKTLSDPSEEVIRSDLRLLAQISSASEERNDAYFRSFMVNLVSLFSTDRRLLETRGSLILRQLCASLHTERIFRTLAEILERDEDLEFASVMVTNMNMILITSPELADFRRRLKNLDSRDGQQLFASLYRSWCHNAVATFSLCLLAQAYEHASNLLQIFAELEITVALLIQIDKLVQLLESPIFTALRLQLLEPERHPYLFKCMYGLLMLLPQSSAFATLRNRLNAVSSMGFLHVAAPRSLYGAGHSSGSGASGGSLPSGAAAGSGNSSTGPRSKLGSRDDIKWNELLTHFRKVQARHEQARRAGGLASGLEADGSLVPGMARASLGGSPGGAGALRGPLPASRVGSAGSSRRKASGASAHPPGSGSRFGMGSATAPASSSSGSKLASAPASSSFFGLHLSGGASSAAPGPSVPSGTSRPTSPISARKGQPRNVSAQFATKR
jgi:vacuole morphology and inheritance protein 14